MLKHKAESVAFVAIIFMLFSSVYLDAENKKELKNNQGRAANSEQNSTHIGNEELLRELSQRTMEKRED